MDTPPAEVSIDAALVGRLVMAQHPALLGPISRLSSGWDNELFRLGDGYVVRMPRRAIAVPLLGNEQRWLPELQALVELPLPVPVAIGRPDGGYPWPWSITPWLPGEPVAHLAVADRSAIVRPLARFLRQLHVPAPADAPVNPVRGTPLAARDAAVRSRLGWPGMPRAAELLRLWEHALAAPPFAGPPLWMHGDLHPINALADASGALTAVIDFGDLGAADPACDLAAAWVFFDAEQRAGFREQIGSDGPHDAAAWQRAVGWAVAEASAFAQNSADAPVLDAIGRHAIEQLVSDLVAGAL
jgi:aminoglycoside phosphotransferase (APT) family kinase protein